MEATRRQLLATAATAGSIGAIAGCTGSESSEADTQASFFVFRDIVSQVAGDVRDTELLVPIGQHGHGWEPGPSVREDIRNASVFVHGNEGFQPWADSIITDLEADDAGVVAINVTGGVDLLEPGADGGHDHGDHDDEEEHHDDEEEEHHDDEEGEEHHDEEGEEHHDEEEEEHHDDEEEHHDEEEEEHHDDEEHDEEEAEHDHGAMDPHFWMDPLRMKDAATTVQQEFTDIDSDNATAYADNTDSFEAALDDLHEQLETLVAEASKETLLVAGHDALSYFGDRYDIRVESLTGVSPDDSPTTADISEAQDIIDEHDLQYIVADPLESQTAAEQLVAETDVEAVLDLTAMAGLKEEWSDNDWGYIEIMENVNLPTLEDALDA